MAKLPSPVLVLIALAALALAACSRPASSLFTQPAPAATAAGLAPRIVVLRGDVMVIDGRHIRLADASAPMPTPAARCPAEAVASRQAQLRLEALTRGVRQATVTPTGGVDDHGRQWARVVLDGADPAQTLINEGLAVAPQQHGFDWCASSSTTQPAAEHIAMLSYFGE